MEHDAAPGESSSGTGKKKQPASSDGRSDAAPNAVRVVSTRKDISRGESPDQKILCTNDVQIQLPSAELTHEQKHRGRETGDIIELRPEMSSIV